MTNVLILDKRDLSFEVSDHKKQISHE